jgi:hypothetical protein
VQESVSTGQGSLRDFKYMLILTQSEGTCISYFKLKEVEEKF